MFFPRKTATRIALTALALAAANGAWTGAWAQESKMNLFKVVTIQDEIIIGLSETELKALGSTDAGAGAVAHALTRKGDITVWRYNVKRGPNGEMQQAPTAKIGLIANTSLRVEPYATPYTVIPHE